ncbi:MAG: hypothetical protein NVS1B1_10100 [Candidatus Limnocylindrales bacterium]
MPQHRRIRGITDARDGPGYGAPMRSPLITVLLREALHALTRLREPAYIRVRPASAPRAGRKVRQAA